MGQIDDPFLVWLKETFVDQQQDNDPLVNDQHLVALPSWQMQQVPDTQLLVAQMQAPIQLVHSSPGPAMPDIGIASPQHSADGRSEPEQANSRAVGAKKTQRPKNTKRYKSVAQKEAHKRYRERKKQNISAMEQEVAEKRQLLQHLEAENAALKSKMRVLETSVSCSTEIHGLLQLINGVSSMSLNGSSSYSGSPVDSTSTSSELNTQALADSSRAAAIPPAELCLHLRHHSSGSISGGTPVSPAPDALSSGSNDQLLQLQALQQSAVVSKQECDVLDQLLNPYQGNCIQRQQQHQHYHQRMVTTGLQHAGSSTATAISAKQELQQLGASVHSVSHPAGEAAHVASGAAAGMRSSDSTSSAAVADVAVHGASFSAGQPDAAGLVGSLSGSSHPSSSASSLHEIFAEVKQRSQFQKLQAVGGAMTAVSPGGVDPLANAVSSVEQGIVAYKAFLQKASALLMERETSNPDAAAAADQQLDRWTRSTIAQIFQPFLVAKGQGVVYESANRNLETLQHQEPPEDLWPHVALQMKLSPQQRQDAVACYRMFGVCLSRLVDQRLALTAQYKAHQQAEEAASQEGNLKRKLQFKIQSMEMLQAISKSLTAYQSLDGVFAHSVTSIITGSQLAVACVYSYPFLPNWHKIAHSLQVSQEQEIALQHQDVPMQQQLQKPARRARVGRTAQQLGVQHAVKA